MALTPEEARRVAGVLLGPDDGTVPGMADDDDAGFGGRLGPGPFGRYEIVRLVGIGGMGEVYEAQQHSPQRRVALKVIRPELVSPELRRRFDYEARTLARLQHPSIAKVFDAGQAESIWGRTPYFAMEFVEGRPLTQYARDRNLGTRERLELFLRICEAVEHAHQSGVIHRDLKPANILIDAEGRPRILDFGMARATDHDVRTTSIHTEAGKLVGTLPYMSPEQVAGDVEHVDTRSDVYSLGVVLYELLAERLPYEIKRGLVHDAVRVIREEDPAPLSSISRSFRGDVETIAAKALEKEAVRRYQSVGELAGDIRRFLSDEPIVARRAGTWYQLRKFGRRNQPFVVATILALSGLLIATALSTWFALSQRQALIEVAHARELAEEQRALALVSSEEALRRGRQADREAARSEAVTSFLQSLLGAADPGVDGRDVKVVDVLARAPEQVMESLKDEPEVGAAVLQAVGGIYRSLGQYQDAADTLLAAGSLLEAAERDVLHFRLGIDADLGLALLMNGAYQQADELLRRVQQESLPIEGESGRTYLRASSTRCAVLKELGRFEESEALARRTIEAAERSLGPLHPVTMTTMSYLGMVLENLERWPEAEVLMRGLYEREVELSGPHSPSAFSHLTNLALNLRWQGRLEEAEQLLTESLPIKEQVLGPNHPSTLTSLNNLAGIYFSRGEFEQALQITEALIPRQRQVLRPDHPRVGELLGNYAINLREVGRFDEAEAAYREAIGLLTNALGPANRITVEMSYNLGLLLARMTRNEEALEVFDHVLANLAGFESAEPAYAAIFGMDRGHALAELERFHEAEEQFLKSWAFARDHGNHFAKITVLHALVNLYTAWGRDDMVEKYAALLEPFKKPHPR